MNPLHKAYQVLGLEPGTSFESIKRRYKRFVMVWHPDRMHNDDGRREAEEELKQINHAFDTLRAHFEKHHRPGTTCDCQPSAHRAGGAGKPNDQSQADPTGEDRKREQDRRRKEEDARRQEEDARRQEEERRRRANAAAADEAARKAEQDRRAADAAKQTMKTAAEQKQQLHAEQPRWRMTLLAGAALVLVLLFASVGIAARAAITELQKQWTDHNPLAFSSLPAQPPSPVKPIAQPPADDPNNPYIPLEYRFPGGNPATWRRFMQDQELRQKQREAEQHKQDLYFTKLAVDRNLKIIDHCTNTIAQLEARIADPNVSPFYRNKLIEYRDFQQCNLEAARQELAAEQQKISMLQYPRWRL